MVNLMRLGCKIQDMRRIRQITQQQLAERIEVSDVYMGYVEQGKRGCSVATYIDIVNALGYTLDDLFAEYLVHKGPALPTDTKALIADFSDVQLETLYEIILSLKKLVQNEHTEGIHNYSTAPRNK